MQLTIITPFHKEEFVINWIEVRTKTGLRIIQNLHEPFLNELSPKSMVSFELQNQQVIARSVTQGFVSVERTRITLLLSN